jgi:acetylornithine deacetylase/succinyl-diaminopimelate desuccinylase-like protein
LSSKAVSAASVEPAAAFLADWLVDTGVEPQILESAPGRANLVARLAGGDEPALLLSAHLDVVGVEDDQWTHPPFAGEIHDGFVWGRGAVDMKQMAAMSAVTLALVRRLGVPLRRDVVFAGVADEEAGCDLGSRWLVDHHPDVVRAGYALGEVGGFTLDVGGTPVYPIQVAEKGICWLRASTHGPSGHGSLPRDDTAVLELAALLRRVGERRLRVRPSAVAERFVAELLDAVGGRAPALLPLLVHPRTSGAAVGRLVRDAATARPLHSIQANTVTPTVVRAGSKTNVIPGVAEVELDGRIAVGSNVEEFVAEVARLTGPDVRLEVIKQHPPTVARADTDLFVTLAGVVADHHPGARGVPSVTPGFTDASAWSRLGLTCYGFSPLRLRPEHGVRFAELFHAADERIPVDGFRAGLRMLVDAVLRFCAAR